MGRGDGCFRRGMILIILIPKGDAIPPQLVCWKQVGYWTKSEAKANLNRPRHHTPPTKHDRPNFSMCAWVHSPSNLNIVYILTLWHLLQYFLILNTLFFYDTLVLTHDILITVLSQYTWFLSLLRMITYNRIVWLQYLNIHVQFFECFDAVQFTSHDWLTAVVKINIQCCECFNAV